MKKAKLSTKDILHLANLSALKLSPEEEKKIEKQLSETLDYVQNLEELDTSQVLPTNHTVDLINEYFEDGKTCERKLSEKEVFKNSKNRRGKYFAVKKIL